MSEVATRERTQERIVVETDTETEMQCPHCEQWYEPESMVPIGIGVAERTDTQPWDTTQLCEHCLELVFDRQPPDSAVGHIRDVFERASAGVVFAGGVIGLSAIVAVGGLLALVLYPGFVMIAADTADPEILMGIMLATAAIFGFAIMVMVGAIHYLSWRFDIDPSDSSETTRR